MKHKAAQQKYYSLMNTLEYTPIKYSHTDLYNLTSTVHAHRQSAIKYNSLHRVLMMATDRQADKLNERQAALECWSISYSIVFTMATASTFILSEHL